MTGTDTTGTKQQPLAVAHAAGCAEGIRVRELTRAGDPEQPDLVVLHRIADQIQACCGLNALKAHRRAWGWTVEAAVQRFHAMCADHRLGVRGLVARSWQGWEADDSRPNDDYRDLLCRLFQTSAVRLGFATDHTPPTIPADRMSAALEPASAALVGDLYAGPHGQPDLAGLADLQVGALLRVLVLAMGAVGGAGPLAGPGRQFSATTVPSVGVPAVVAGWSGREVVALRTAYRMSKREFADRLGVTHKAVHLWEYEHRPIGPASQAALDTLLSRADPDTQARFWLVLSQGACRCTTGADGQPTPDQPTGHRADDKGTSVHGTEDEGRQSRRRDE
jgi:hypothetical protein